MTQPATPEQAKAPRERSPSFPFISLKTAVARLVALDAKFGRHAAPNDKIGLAWEMKSKSSQALQTTAALKAYGLVEYAGSGENLQVSISTDGRNYLRAQQESVKAEILKRCALNPKVLARCWSTWGADRPIDEVCLDELMLKQSFTDSAARTLLRVYDETIAFAKLASGDKLASEAGGEEPDEITLSPAVKPKVGEHVRWESNGVIMFDSRPVLGLSPDGEYVFVQGSPAGLPVKEVTVVTPNVQVPPPSAAPSNPFVQPIPPDQPAAGMKGDVFTFPERDAHAVFQWPDTMSAAELEDLEDWLKIKLRGIKRSIQ